MFENSKSSSDIRIMFHRTALDWNFFNLAEFCVATYTSKAYNTSPSLNIVVVIFVEKWHIGLGKG